MSETDNDKPKLGMRAPLGVKRTVETGKVKQSFSHGRSNTVVVEVKRRRVLGPQGAAPEQPAPEPTPAPAPVARVADTPPRPAAGVSHQLSPQERQAKLLREAEEQRMRALEDARHREDAERARAAEEAAEAARRRRSVVDCTRVL